MPPAPLRTYDGWILTGPYDPTTPARQWNESASFPLLLEALQRHSEITSFGKSLFSGSQATKNLRWYQYRNLVRQALSNFRAALGVPNRSACLLYYYAMLNFAKAELLDTHPSDVTGKIRHGLSFDPTSAKTVAGDRLIIRDGVFKLLYEKRTGRSLPTGTALPVKRLLANIPEIGTQVGDAGLGSCRIGGFLHMIAVNGQASWPTLALMGPDVASWGVATAKIFSSVFEEVDLSSPISRMKVRDDFAISRRSTQAPIVYQSRDVAGNRIADGLNIQDSLAITWRIRDLIGLRTTESVDAFLVPSLYKRELLVMPPSLCRYAATFYASSLVRYRPYMFDGGRYPEQAYMFDAIARECALPMLIDTVSGLEGVPHLFYAPGAMRR